MISLREGETKYFYFNFRNKISDLKTDLRFILEAVYGKFKVCIQNSKTRPKNLDKCEHNESFDAREQVSFLK